MIPHAMFPPMHPEALQWFDSVLDLGSTESIGGGEPDLGMEQQHHHQVQHQQHEKHQQQTMDSETQSLKLDLLTGRAGDPPGLGLGPGSSLKTEVKLRIGISKTDNSSLPMTTGELSCVDATQQNQEIGSATESSAAAPTHQEVVPDHPGVQSQTRSPEWGLSEECAMADTKSLASSLLSCDR